MNRKIAFRAWDGFRKQMWNNFVVGASHGRPMTESRTDFDNPYLCPQDWSVMQFTGLHDSKGVEIYEGDILRCNSSDDDWNDEVVYGYTGYELGRWNKENAHLYPHFSEVIEDCEIIGNLYETPELLSHEK